AIALRKDASIEKTIAKTDAVLKPYGGVGAYGREDQFSHSFLDSELDQLRAMASVIPPIFLMVAAFLVNMILSRLIALEREQIGLLKAVGYGPFDVAAHYGKMVVIIAIIGLVIGSVFGFWLSRGLTQLYAQFFSFPFLVFSPSPDLYIIAGGVTVAAGLLGAAKAVLGVVLLPPAVAMQPPAPADYTSVFTRWMKQTRLMSQLTTMAMRHLLHRPIRALLTIFGTAMPVALLTTSLFTYDSIDSMIDTIFFQTERQDATLIFAEETSPWALHDVAALPGVLRSEPFRATEVIIRKEHRSVRTEVFGIPARTELSRILDIEGNPVSPPQDGVMLSERVADKLAVRPGDEISLVLLKWNRREVSVQVTGLTHSLIGLAVFTRLERLNTMIGEGPRISGTRVGLDSDRLDNIYKIIKRTPAIASIALSNLSRDKFRETVERNISISAQVYIVLAIVITFGVIYNSARIQLSERARELASLRVFGFTRGEVSRVLMSELAIIVLIAQPIGWLVGYGFAWSVVQGFESDLFRIPLVIERSTYAISSLVVLGAALVSALIVRRRINRLDLIRVLKTRE
ncbi:MAG: FtsX-like permease family protein, partial [Rhizobiaceae bacterium]